MIDLHGLRLGRLHQDKLIGSPPLFLGQMQSADFFIVGQNLL